PVHREPIRAPRSTKGTPEEAMTESPSRSSSARTFGLAARKAIPTMPASTRVRPDQLKASKRRSTLGSGQVTTAPTAEPGRGGRSPSLPVAAPVASAPSRPSSGQYGVVLPMVRKGENQANDRPPERE